MNGRYSAFVNEKKSDGLILSRIKCGWFFKVRWKLEQSDKILRKAQAVKKYRFYGW